MFTPTDICNEALDAIGVDAFLGDIEDGSREAQVCLRHYPVCLRQLLRSAHWNFARKQVPMVLLADATGQATTVSTTPIKPWIYEYSYPTDCLKVRFVPFRLDCANAQSIPFTTADQFAPPYGLRLRPAPYLIAQDVNFPPDPGSDYSQVQGVSPQGRTVVLTNVKDAECVYTSLVLYPSEWDSLFRAALVAYLAQKIALVLVKDQKAGLVIRGQQIAMVKDAIGQARATDGNEGVHSVTHIPDWITGRWVNGLASFSGDWDGHGLRWDQLSFADGSAY